MHCHANYSMLLICKWENGQYTNIHFIILDVASHFCITKVLKMYNNNNNYFHFQIGDKLVRGKNFH